MIANARGGSWDNDHWFCRSSTRFRCEPGFTCDSLGFRVVLIDHLPQQETKDHD
jgi:formylglycine-generating enzyme required for sulfatase activity